MTDEQNMNKTRPHGWHWWKGRAPGKNIFGHEYTAARQWVVHCWISSGDDCEAYASSANWRCPMKQSEMTRYGTWGPEVVWNPDNKDNTSLNTLLDKIEKVLADEAHILANPIDLADPFRYNEHGYHCQD